LATVKEIIPSEHEEQCLVFTWAAYMKGKHPELGLLFSIPNQGGFGKSAMIRGRLMVAAGLKAGVPDLFLPVSRMVDGKRKHGLFIEMKRQKDSYARKGQKEWLRKLRAERYEAVVCRGADEAIKTICEYLEVSDGAR
jgi:hypothetical protein